MISIQYLNKFSEPISSEQAKASGEFIKQEFVDDKLKMEELYRDTRVTSVTYFLDEG